MYKLIEAERGSLYKFILYFLPPSTKRILKKSKSSDEPPGAISDGRKIFFNIR